MKTNGQISEILSFNCCCCRRCCCCFTAVCVVFRPALRVLGIIKYKQLQLLAAVLELFLDVSQIQTDHKPHKKFRIDLYGTRYRVYRTRYVWQRAEQMLFTYCSRNLMQEILIDFGMNSQIISAI